MKTFNQFRQNEALKFSKARELYNTTKDSLNERVQDFFGQNKRLYFDLNGNLVNIDKKTRTIKSNNQNSSSIDDWKKAINNLIQEIDFELDPNDIFSAINMRNNQKTSIFKVLNRIDFKLELKKEIEKFLQVYKSKQGENKDTTEELYICLSRDSYDLGGMSTDRHWKSCRSEDSGNYQYIYNEIKIGVLIAYIIQPNDTNINNPVGRNLVLPYVNQSNLNDTIYLPAFKTYGKTHPSFKSALDKICTRLNNGIDPDSLYELNVNVYKDGNSNYYFKDEQSLRKYLTKNKGNLQGYKVYSIYREFNKKLDNCAYKISNDQKYILFYDENSFWLYDFEYNIVSKDILFQYDEFINIHLQFFFEGSETGYRNYTFNTNSDIIVIFISKSKKDIEEGYIALYNKTKHDYTKGSFTEMIDQIDFSTAVIEDSELTRAITRSKTNLDIVKNVSTIGDYILVDTAQYRFEYKLCYTKNFELVKNIPEDLDNAHILVYFGIMNNIYNFKAHYVFSDRVFYNGTNVNFDFDLNNKEKIKLVFDVNDLDLKKHEDASKFLTYYALKWIDQFEKYDPSFDEKDIVIYDNTYIIYGKYQYINVKTGKYYTLESINDTIENFDLNLCNIWNKYIVKDIIGYNDLDKVGKNTFIGWNYNKSSIKIIDNYGKEKENNFDTFRIVFDKIKITDKPNGESYFKGAIYLRQYYNNIIEDKEEYTYTMKPYRNDLDTNTVLIVQDRNDNKEYHYFVFKDMKLEKVDFKTFSRLAKEN